MPTQGKTERFNTPDQYLDRPLPDRFDFGFTLPWRIGLTIKSSSVQLFIQLGTPVMVGRIGTNSLDIPDIDLAPFGAQQKGVSRCHASIARLDSQVVVIDNHSSNGTILNGYRLVPDQAYPLHHGDALTLGLFELSISLLVNPMR